jgi:ketosteroid isomerase-like protein
MSRENVDLVRSIYAAWERGDFSSAGWASPQIEYVVADGPTPGTSTGLGGMAKAMRDFLSAWEGFRVEADEYRALDDERVLVLVHRAGRGKTSGLELGHMHGGAILFHVSGGRVTRLVVYQNRERAFAEVGIPPERHGRALRGILHDQ